MLVNNGNFFQHKVALYDVIDEIMFVPIKKFIAYRKLNHDTNIIQIFVMI